MAERFHRVMKERGLGKRFQGDPSTAADLDG
jgi:hypothetical protein